MRFNKKWITLCYLTAATFLAVYGAVLAAVNVTADIPSVCDNSVKDSGEQCDNNDLGGRDCVYLNFTGGDLSCSDACEFETSACVTDAEVTATSSFSTATGGSYAVFNIDDTYAVVSLPANFYGQDLNLQAFSYANDYFETVKPAPSGKNFVGKTYDFLFIDPNANKISTLSQPADLTLNYDDANVSGIVESGLAPYHWGSDDSSWQPILSFTLNTINNEVVFPNSSFSSFALFGTPIPPTPPPTQPQPPSGGGSSGFFFLPPKKPVSLSAVDFNNDGRINIQDFSILLYHVNQKPAPASYDLNSDGKIDIIDISILLYHWT